MLNDLHFVIQQPFLFSLGSNINNRTKDAHTGLNENRASRALYSPAHLTPCRLYYLLTYCTSPEPGKAIPVSASLMAAAFWGVFKQKEPADKQQSLS